MKVQLEISLKRDHGPTVVKSQEVAEALRDVIEDEIEVWLGETKFTIEYVSIKALEGEDL